MDDDDGHMDDAANSSVRSTSYRHITLPVEGALPVCGGQSRRRTGGRLVFPQIVTSPDFLLLQVTLTPTHRSWNKHTRAATG